MAARPRSCNAPQSEVLPGALHGAFGQYGESRSDDGARPSDCG
ncbi:hypothetical protein P355_0455 [Burkholderia cenocepacia KC-01]|nr:hypothetical protein P355_0455 [Burkholderia cenocepacia KC-01]